MDSDSQVGRGKRRRKNNRLLPLLKRVLGKTFETQSITLCAQARVEPSMHSTIHCYFSRARISNFEYLVV
jgi:hypothetical protein